MNSKEAFEEIVKVCNYYHKKISNVDCESVCGYPIKKNRKRFRSIRNHKKVVFYSRKLQRIF